MTVTYLNKMNNSLEDIENIRYTSIAGLTEAHRYMSAMKLNTHPITAFATMMDSVVGDDKAAEFIGTNSKATYADHEAADVKKIFPRYNLDIAHIDAIIYNAVEAIEDLLNTLKGWLGLGSESLQRAIMVLHDLANSLKRMALDTMLKIFIHNRIELLIKSAPTTIRAA